MEIERHLSISVDIQETWHQGRVERTQISVSIPAQRQVKLHKKGLGGSTHKTYSPTARNSSPTKLCSYCHIKVMTQ
jgi:hypothetical protein